MSRGQACCWCLLCLQKQSNGFWFQTTAVSPLISWHQDVSTPAPVYNGNLLATHIFVGNMCRIMFPIYMWIVDKANQRKILLCCKMYVQPETPQDLSIIIYELPENCVFCVYIYMVKGFENKWEISAELLLQIYSLLENIYRWTYYLIGPSQCTWRRKLKDSEYCEI